MDNLNQGPTRPHPQSRGNRFRQDPPVQPKPDLLVSRRPYPLRVPRRRKRKFPVFGCLVLITPFIILAIILGVYFLFPMRTNVLLIGIDYVEPGSYAARTDTLILTTFEPLEPYVGMLSIPRDLWVQIPGVGENRINTAHFYAEIEQSGRGPQAVMDTVNSNFGVKPHYYLRIRFEGFRELVDVLGGVEIQLEKPTAGYPAGTHFLKPRKALAFVRHRASSDDFNRMSNGQFMLKSLMKNMLYPQNWKHIPDFIRTFSNVVDSNIPEWLWPRLTLTLLRVGPGGIDNRIIDREMTTSFITSSGAYVLSPDWPKINVILIQMFHR